MKKPRILSVREWLALEEKKNKKKEQLDKISSQQLKLEL